MLAAFAVLLLTVVTVLAVGPGRPPDPQVARAEAPARHLLAFEAEAAQDYTPPMRTLAHPSAARGTCLGVPLGAGKPPEAAEGRARYALAVEHAGAYRLWIRAWWIDGCSNSVAASFDGRAPEPIGNDGTYGRWHWVKGPRLDLAAGAHELLLLHREDGIELDQLALCDDEAFEPEGALETAAGATEVAQAVESPAPVTPAKTETPAEAPASKTQPEPAPKPESPQTPAAPAPDLPTPPARPIKKFVVGIAGCYRDGWEMHLVHLGIPYVRLREEETGEIEKLKDIDLLIVGDPRPSGGASAFYTTLYAFLKSGRTAIVEDPPEGYAEGADPDNLLLRRGAPRDVSRVTLQADDSIYFKDVPKSRTYDPDVRCHWLPASTSAPDAKIFGNVTMGRRGPRAGALLVRNYGGGKLYFLGFPAAFAAMWRERTIDPYVVNILRDAIGERTPFRLEGFAYAPAQDERVSLSDDFMRSKGELGAWKVVDGSFASTGPLESDEGFAFKGRGDARAETGAAGWQDYRPMVALKMQSGRAGLWHATEGGGRLALLFEQTRDGAKVSLLERDAHGAEKTLGEAEVPDYGGGWRRLALFQRGGRTYAFVDGAQALDVPGGPAAKGPCGVEVRGGAAFFDDFKAVDVAALEPGRDVAPGEESSQRCLDRYRQRCFERLSVYSPQWFLEPDPSDAGLWRFALPLFKGGTLMADGRPSARVPAGDGFPALRFLENKTPASDVAMDAPGLRDFHFAGRVTDWYASSGQWEQGNRWSCSPEYQWYSGASQQLAALWYKHPVRGKAALEVLMAPRADQYFGQEQGRDLNLCVFGNGRDLSKGYLFVVGAEGQGCRILKDGKELASAPDAGLPSGHALHHPWFSVTAVAVNGKLQLWFDRRLACEATDPEPLTQGQIGIWTQRNKISVGRATLSLEP
ncbi:MAG: hypothetical protein KIS92_20160 [Planctomycetota bacterium]|nr:hypothetical protein [Planctomycetota bacterium]